MAKVLTSGVVLGLANHTLLLARDGTERPINDTGAPIRDHDGRLAGVVWIFRDITERRRAEQAAEAARAYAEAIVEAAGLTLDLQLPDQALWVRGDPTRLAQIVGNLLHNASKFTDPGGYVSVQVTQDAGGDTAVIAVRDTGIGMDPKMLAEVFETFRQGENGRDHNRGGAWPGVGVGQGGGRVARRYRARRQRKTRARLQDHGPAPDGARPGAAQAGESHSRTCRASVPDLVIEDNRDAAESMKILLGLVGHRVETASTGAAGVDVARAFHPQVVLCDIGLPGGTASRVLRR